MNAPRMALLPPSLPLPDGEPVSRWWMRRRVLGWPLRLLWRIWHRRSEDASRWWMRTSSSTVAIGWPLKGSWLLWRLGLSIGFKHIVETGRSYGSRRQIRITISWPTKNKTT